MDIYRFLASALEENCLAHYELACSKRSGYWIVDSGAKWGTEENKRGRQ